MILLAKGRYAARLAETGADITAAQRLRWLAFVANRGLAGTDDDGLDADEFDSRCRHVLIEETATGTLVSCFRLMILCDGSALPESYAARHYDLSALSQYRGQMLELGRFCIHPAHSDPDILRLAWAALTRIVEAEGVAMLFGCSSFMGTKTESYLDTFAMLKDHHLGPRGWLPRVKAPDVFRFARRLRLRKPDMRRAMQAMPPLLRSYLAMGGWVSDHAVVDRDLNTLHVFTGLEVASIPAARVRLLRAGAA